MGFHPMVFIQFMSCLNSSKSSTVETSTSQPSAGQTPPSPALMSPDQTSSSASTGGETMTVTQALVDLKTLDKRIQKLTNETVFVSLKGELRQPDVRMGKSVSNYQKITDLLARRVKMKSAIVSSNALTRVLVADRNMTVAEAIELKSSIKNYKTLLGQLKAQYGQNVQQMEHENNRVRSNLENTLKKNEEKQDHQMSVVDYSRSYMKMHGVELCDPLNATKKIEELEKFITDFETSVDVVLSVTNATTTITL